MPRDFVCVPGNRSYTLWDPVVLVVSRTLPPKSPLSFHGRDTLLFSISTAVHPTLFSIADPSVHIMVLFALLIDVANDCLACSVYSGFWICRGGVHRQLCPSGECSSMSFGLIW